jgi:hypothetical protein
MSRPAIARKSVVLPQPEGPTPLDGEELEALIKEVPRDAETVNLFRQFAGPGPLPSR